MKKFLSISIILLPFALLVSTLCAPAFGQNDRQAGHKVYGYEDIPNVQLHDARRFVSNPDGLLSTEAVYRIDTMLWSLRQSGRAQVAVIAVGSIGNADPFDFLHTLISDETQWNGRKSGEFKGWGVGDKNKDNGLGILLVIDQGAIEIQTGYGLEGDLPDAILKRIINTYMLPAFRQQDWDGGMVAGVEAIRDVLNGIPPAELSATEEGGGTRLLIALLGLMAFPFIAVLAAIHFSKRCPRCKKHTLHRTGSKMVVKNGRKVEEITYTCKNCGNVVVRNRNHGGGSGLGPIIGGGTMGGGFGHGGSGGFGGGSWGGGSFGGGGSGGRF